jgi:hypothetical protein
MIYAFSLQTAALVAGALLVLVSLLALLVPALRQEWAARFPRSTTAGAILLAVDLLWSFWLLLTMEMGEFSNFRRPLLVLLPIGFFLVLKYVSEFLAVRALGILFLLAAEPLLESAFLRYEQSRLLLTVLAYVMIVAGLFWVTMPYLLRDEIEWSRRSNLRWKFISGIVFAFGAALVVCAITIY